MRHFLQQQSRSGQDLFFSYYKVVSVGIVEFISVVISQESVGIVVIASTVVVGRGVIDVFVTRLAMVGIVVVFGSSIVSLWGIRGAVW